MQVEFYAPIIKAAIARPVYLPVKDRCLFGANLVLCATFGNIASISAEIIGHLKEETNSVNPDLH